MLVDALQVFYGRVGNGEKRITVLKDYARIVVSREATYRQVRRAPYMRPTRGGTCWACLEPSARLITHHIIQVQHGGRNILKNLVWVCRVCHARIHPWLTKPLPAPVFDPTPRLVKP